MPDVFTKEKRSAVMALIRGRGNKSTELRLIALMRQAEITGWRRHWPINGRPDFVFPRHRLAVFLDGCFWHGCPRCYQPPKRNGAFWATKISGNRKRDADVTKFLRKAGWKVIRIWEHQLARNPESVLRRLKRCLGK